MSIELIPLAKAAKPNIQTPSKLEPSITVSDQEFGQHYKQGAYCPVSQDASGTGEVTVQPAFFDSRNGMKCSYLAKKK